MTAEEVMEMCEKGECRIIYGDILLMRTINGAVYVSFDGRGWEETSEEMFLKQFNKSKEYSL